MHNGLRATAVYLSRDLYQNLSVQDLTVELAAADVIAFVLQVMILKYATRLYRLAAGYQGHEQIVPWQLQAAVGLLTAHLFVGETLKSWEKEALQLRVKWMKLCYQLQFDAKMDS